MNNWSQIFNSLSTLTNTTVTNTVTSIILPLIRQVMPNLIANQIVGVQPMTWPGDSIEDDVVRVGEVEFEFDNYTKARTAYFVKPYAFRMNSLFLTRYDDDPVDKMSAWCIERFGESGKLQPRIGVRWVLKDRTFFFRKKQDRTMFLLKWGDEVYGTRR